MKFYLQLGMLLVMATNLLICANNVNSAELVIVENNKSTAKIISSPLSGFQEKIAASDLQKYIKLISGVEIPIINNRKEINDALKTSDPLFVIGQEAIRIKPSLSRQLRQVQKKDYLLRSDAIAVQREKNKILLAGSNDDSISYAVSWILEQWGCHWYMPGKFGECIPEKKVLSIEKLNFVYAPPFEVRRYWISWNGTQEGREDFMRRNMLNDEKIPAGHRLGSYTKELIPEGKTLYDIPIATDETVEHVARQLEKDFSQSKIISLGMEDGVYNIDNPIDKQLQMGLRDKYFQNESMTDNFMTFYNKIGHKLISKYPDSKSLISFLAYSNITIPPQRKMLAAKPLIAYLAPIDIDPNHGMDSPDSPQRQEYKAMMYRWAEIMQGRLVIYDYDQGMLVWRDLPNPSFQAFKTDVKHYRDAGVLGVDTESRGALATTFLNIYLRGKLMWNPDADIKVLLKEFYPQFYGPAASAMEKYWDVIYQAWENTIVTEHEYFVIPSIYTPDLVNCLGKFMQQAEHDASALKKNVSGLSRNEKLYLERLEFTRASYELIKLYTQMLRHSATNADYVQAFEIGKRGRSAQINLANLNPLFTSRVVGAAAQTEKNGPAWWPGEVAQYGEIAKKQNGEQGKLVAKTPLEWSFRADPRDAGMVSGWAYEPIDMSYWDENKANIYSHNLKDYPMEKWSKLRTDEYMQAQGVRFPDGHDYSGYYWYSTEINFTAQQISQPIHLLFPGLFNECWLYINGSLVDYRNDYTEPWWRSGYRFEWDVRVINYLRPGRNTITLRGKCVTHMGGIFRRPFFYQPVSH